MKKASKRKEDTTRFLPVPDIGEQPVAEEDDDSFVELASKKSPERSLAVGGSLQKRAKVPPIKVGTSSSPNNLDVFLNAPVEKLEYLNSIMPVAKQKTIGGVNPMKRTEFLSPSPEEGQKISGFGQVFKGGISNEEASNSLQKLRAYVSKRERKGKTNNEGQSGDTGQDRIQEDQEEDEDTEDEDDDELKFHIMQLIKLVKVEFGN
jgi:hypothetical protein